MRLLGAEQTEAYRKQEKTSWLAFLSELPNLIASVAAACFANTLLCWMDCVGSLEATIHCLLVAIISGKMKKETGRIFNYGMDRLEIFISMLCDSLALLGMLAVVVSAVYGLFVPQLPDDSLLWFLLLKLCNISFDLYFLFSQRKIGRMHRSKLNESELKNSWFNLASDVAVGVSVCVCYAFRKQLWVAYLSPILSILMSAFFTKGYLQHLRLSVMELADVALPDQLQGQIFEILQKYAPEYWEIRDVGTHMLNGRAQIDVFVQMPESATFSEQNEYLLTVRNNIRAILPDADIRLFI